MKLLLIVLALSLVIMPTYQLYGPNSKVVKLTQANFKEKVLNSKDPWIIEFYAPWCGHCKSMAAGYEKAAVALSGMVNLGAVDMTTDQAVGSPYGISGFPTLKLFGDNKNKPTDFNGGRTDKEFVTAGINMVRDIANSRLGGGSSSNQQKSSGGSQGSQGGQAGGSGAVNLTASTYKVKGNGIWFIMYMAPWCGHCKSAKPHFNNAANNFKDGKVNFGVVDCTVEQSLCQGVQGYPTFKSYDVNGKASDFNGNRDLGGFTNYARGLAGMEEAANPSVPDLPFVQMTSQKVFEDYCTKVKSSICIMSFLPHILDVSPEDRAVHVQIIQDVNKKMSGKPYNFLWSQGGDQYEFEESMNLGMGYPAVIALVAGKKKFAIMRRSWSKENLEMFVNGLASNREHFYDVRELPTKLKTVDAYDAKKAQKTEKDL